MEVTLKAERGRGKGKGPAKALRREGRVPAVVYGQTTEPEAISVDSRELRAALSTEAGRNILITLEIGEDGHLTLAREIQRDPLRGDFVHVDFVAIRRDQAVQATVPVNLTGESPAVSLGLIIENHAISVIVSCLPTDVPSSLEASLDGLTEVGDAVKAADLALPENVSLVTDPDESIAVVIPPPVMVLEEEVAEGEEGEVVEGEEGEGAEGEEGEGGKAKGAEGTSGAKESEG